MCPCCLTQFDFTDSPIRYADLRADWLATGAQWRSRYVVPPSDWNPRACYALEYALESGN